MKRDILKVLEGRTLRQRWSKLIGLPGPKELGKAEDDFLPSRMFGGAESDEYCWEDWRAEMQGKYPVKYFLSEVLPLKVSLAYRPLGEAYYWLKCHLLRSHRYHLLDIRNPGPELEYTHGWLDVTQRLLYSSFVLLRAFVENERPYNVAEALAEHPDDPCLQKQAQDYNEAMALYYWWMVERPDDQRRYGALLREDAALSKQDESRFQKSGDFRKELDDRDQAMLHRLVEIRGYLWT